MLLALMSLARILRLAYNQCMEKLYYTYDEIHKLAQSIAVQVEKAHLAQM